MAYTVTFPTGGPMPGGNELAAWLTEQGEPFEPEGPDVLALRALPVRLVHADDSVRAQLDVTPATPLSRLVRVLFDLSQRLGADVRLVGTGAVSRAELWLRLADEQDRQRVASAIGRAAGHNARDEILRTFWSLLNTVGDGRDLRWDATREHIVELREVGASDGISLEAAAWHDEQAAPGDTISVPVEGHLHILAWRWLSEAWPSLVTT